MNSHVIFDKLGRFCTFLATLDFQVASRQLGLTFFDPKLLQKLPYSVLGKVKIFRLEGRFFEI